MAFIIYHNPRCRKSRETLDLLINNGIEPKVIKYLEEPLNESELKSIVKKLGISAEKLIRKGEEGYKDNYKGRELSEEEAIIAIARDPKLMERPVVINGDKAIIGRPPENVLSLL